MAQRGRPKNAVEQPMETPKVQTIKEMVEAKKAPGIAIKKEPSQRELERLSMQREILIIR